MVEGAGESESTLYSTGNQEIDGANNRLDSTVIEPLVSILAEFLQGLTVVKVDVMPAPELREPNFVYYILPPVSRWQDYYPSLAKLMLVLQTGNKSSRKPL